MNETPTYRTLTERPLRRVGPDFVRYIVRSEDTGSSYFAFEVHTMPGGGPPLHRHDYRECFFVLGGEYTFEIDRDGTLETITAGPGSSLTIPPGRPHTFHNNTPEFAHMIVIHTPAALQGFFEEVGVGVERLGDGQELTFDPGQIRRALAREGVEILAAPQHA
jgi:quercetin dioxygenase-like cupin family protein